MAAFDRGHTPYECLWSKNDTLCSFVCHKTSSEKQQSKQTRCKGLKHKLSRRVVSVYDIVHTCRAFFLNGSTATALHCIRCMLDIHFFPLVQVTSGGKPNAPTHIVAHELCHGFKTTLTIDMLWDRPIFNKPAGTEHTSKGLENVNHKQFKCMPCMDRTPYSPCIEVFVK